MFTCLFNKIGDGLFAGPGFVARAVRTEGIPDICHCEYSCGKLLSPEHSLIYPIFRDVNKGFPGLFADKRLGPAVDKQSLGACE